MTYPTNCEVLPGLLSCGVVQQLFKRSDQTLALWRKNHLMPYVLIESDERPTVRYRLPKLVAWAQETNRVMSPSVLQSLDDSLPCTDSTRRRRFPS